MAHILIAEDDISMAQFLATALERAGHRATVTNHGLEAMKALQGPEDFDLLLTDIVMPGMDGIELSQKAAPMRPKMKIMFITGFTAMAAGDGNPAMQNTRVLSKPFHLNELVEQVNALLKS